MAWLKSSLTLLSGRNTLARRACTLSVSARSTSPVSRVPATATPVTPTRFARRARTTSFSTQMVCVATFAQMATGSCQCGVAWATPAHSVRRTAVCAPVRQFARSAATPRTCRTTTGAKRSVKMATTSRVSTTWAAFARSALRRATSARRKTTARSANSRRSSRTTRPVRQPAHQATIRTGLVMLVESVRPAPTSARSAAPHPAAASAATAFSSRPTAGARKPVQRVTMPWTAPGGWAAPAPCARRTATPATAPRSVQSAGASRTSRNTTSADRSAPMDTMRTAPTASAVAATGVRRHATFARPQTCARNARKPRISHRQVPASTNAPTATTSRALRTSGAFAKRVRQRASTASVRSSARCVRTLRSSRRMRS
ncbi:unnamed protein product, partial [Symbiodinium sp. CCMP2456]